MIHSEFENVYKITNTYSKVINDKKQKISKINETYPVITTPKIGRNEYCHCGSNLKYKKCCINIK